MSNSDNDPLTLALVKCVSSSIHQHRQLLDSFESECTDQIANVARVCLACIQDGGKLLFFGNGGSAADSQHFATELTARFLRDRRAFSAIALTTDTSAITAIANDWHFDEIFSRQIEAIGRVGDLAIGISTSGFSPNVIKAFQKANELDIVTCLLTGSGDSPAVSIADLSVVVPSEETARIQEMHILVGHIICEFIEEQLYLLETTNPSFTNPN